MRPVLVVDHHACGAPFGTQRFIDVEAAATAELVASLIDGLGVALTADMATCLYAGLASDTGSFRYAATGSASHRLAARLLAAGAPHAKISSLLWDTRPASYLTVLTSALTRLKRSDDVIWTVVTVQDLDQAGATIEEAEGVVDVIRVAREHEVAAVLKEDPTGAGGRWKVSVRSRGQADVGAACTALGGGGHRLAAGFGANGQPAEIIARLQAAPRGRRVSGRAAGPDGLLVVDKGTGLTSHDVVAKLRRLASTRKVGHAGTLDPDATGVLVCGVGRATRLPRPPAAGREGSMRPPSRLGITTSTDDAEGEVLRTRPADEITDDAIAAAIIGLSGAILQVPSAVSAIKVNGVRSYARVRAGEAVELAARPITVSRFDVLDRRGDALDIAVTCSSGTYIRALARDLGEALDCGAHLTALRRTRVGPFTLAQARTLEQLAEQLDMMTLDDAVASLFVRRDVSAEDATDLRHGRPLAPSGQSGAVGVFGPDGRVLALVEDKEGRARPLVVLNPA